MTPAFLLALLACGPEPVDTADVIPPPGPLEAGVATARIPAPVGIGTVGFGGFGVSSEGSPFAVTYPATERVHGHPGVKAVVLSRGGPHELVFVRLDTVGVFQQLRRAVVLELEDRLGRDLDDALVLAGTHTHSGPGRIVAGDGVYNLIADVFFPEFYERFVDAIADTVEAAYADLAPARVGYAFGACEEGHTDRRCEDGRDYENSELPVLAVERDGTVDAVLFSYAVHSTVAGIGDLTLTGDVAGAIESRVEDAFDHPVHALFFNSWGADMAPSNPEVATEAGAPLPDGYDQMQAVGHVVARDLHEALADLSWLDEPELAARTHRVRLDREAIGYDDDVFDYPYGGVYCGAGSEPDCDPDTTVDDLDETCIAFPEETPAPTQTVFTAGRIGPLSFVTFPGEPGTELAEQVIADMQELGATDVVFLGYAQDYTGYSILEHDWWQGGYEASGAMWGPRQGEHLASAAVAAWRHLSDGTVDPDAPAALPPFEVGSYDPYAPIPPVDPGTVAVDVAPTYGPADVVTFAVRGADPWLGTPLATLETTDGAPVTRNGGHPLTSDGYGFWVELEVDPPYREDADARTFTWVFSMPVSQRVPGRPELSGAHRLRVAVPIGDGEVVDVVSGAFDITH